VRGTAAFVALTFCIGACGGGEPAPPAKPLPSPAAKPVPAPTPQPAPPAPPTAEVPEGSLRGDARKGGDLYALYCVTCHGKGGKGDGVAAASLDPKPADHSDASYMGRLSDADIYSVIKKGGAAVGKSPLMAPWGGVLPDQQLRDVLAYVRQLSGT